MTTPIWHDLRYGARALCKAPGVTVAAVFTLAVGIGATTTVFTLVNAVLLKPLDYHDPDRLVRVSGGATFTRYEALRQSRSMSGVGAFLVITENAALAGREGAEPLKAARVSANFLDILGVAPVLGRSFVASEEVPGPAVVLISSGLWRARFGSDPHIAGATVRLDAAPCTIAGVLPAGFAFPFAGVDVWRPLQPPAIPLQTRTHSPIFSVFGRLGTGVTLVQASSEIELIDRRYAQEHPGMLDAKPGRPERVLLLRDQLLRDVRRYVWMLSGAVAFVLLIACANVAGLLLARSSSRYREFAIRAALGASRGRLTGQLLTEGVLMAVAGGALGLLLAAFGVPAVRAMPGIALPRAENMHIDGAVLLFTVVLSVSATLIFALAPSLTAAKPDIATILNGAVAGLRRRLGLWRSPRGLMVAGQVALSIVLLTGAALLLESLARLRSVDAGFQPAHLLTMQIGPPPSRYPTSSKQAALFASVVERVQSIPGVRSAAVTLTLPTTGWAGTPVHAVGRPLAKLNERPIAILQTVTPGYFRTLGIALKRGRDFGREDSDGSPPVVIINERLARRFWPSYPAGEDPVGQSLLVGANPAPVRIVGVVGDVRQSALSDDAQDGIYRPRAQTPPMPAAFAVRSQSDPSRLVGAIRREVAGIDPDLTVASVRTMEDVVETSEGQRRLVTVLLGSFAMAGLVLALVGIYGVIAYATSQRTREIGIRRALGAQKADILKLVLRQALSLACIGGTVGILGAAALTRLLKGLLFGVAALDPATFAVVTMLLATLALAAAYIPARRAARIDPAAAVRNG